MPQLMPLLWVCSSLVMFLMAIMMNNLYGFNLGKEMEWKSSNKMGFKNLWLW